MLVGASAGNQFFGGCCFEKEVFCRALRGFYLALPGSCAGLFFTRGPRGCYASEYHLHRRRRRKGAFRPGSGKHYHQRRGGPGAPKRRRNPARSRRRSGGKPAGGKLHRHPFDTRRARALNRAARRGEYTLIPGGQAVGIRLFMRGVLVVGVSNVSSAAGEIKSPAKAAGLSPATSSSRSTALRCRIPITWAISSPLRKGTFC